MRRLAIFPLLILAACEGDKPIDMTEDMVPVDPMLPMPPPPIDGNDLTAVFWFQPDPALDPERLMAGCRMWGNTGLICARADHEAGAEIRVLATHDGCPSNGGRVVLGLADRSRRTIEIMVDCGPELRLDAEQLMLIFLHEVGHAVGMWFHVPPDCSLADAATAPNGEKACGQALMNAYHDSAVRTVMRPDEVAFMLRSEIGAVIGNPTMASCTAHAPDSP